MGCQTRPCRLSVAVNVLFKAILAQSTARRRRPEDPNVSVLRAGSPEGCEANFQNLRIHNRFRARLANPLWVVNTEAKAGSGKL